MENEMESIKETTVTRLTPQRGFEEPVDKEDLIIPRAKLLQALSPEVVENGKDFHAGMIINNLTKEILPETFIPIFKFTQWIRFNSRNPKDENYNPSFGPGDIIWRSVDPYDPRVTKEGIFGPNGERPLATKFLNFLSYFSGVEMPVVVSFANTSLKAGRQLLSLAKFSLDHIYARQYLLNCKQESNDMGTYFVFTVRLLGRTEKKDYEIAEAWWNDYHDRTIQVHEEQTEGSDSGAENRPF